MQIKTEFKIFIVLWNRHEGRDTPALHMKIADWLERNWTKGNTKLLLMAFRSSGKSTLVGLFSAWLLHRNPDLRILVLAADYALASKMVQQVRKIIETHPLTGHLKPEKPDQWAGNRFTVNRLLKLRDPSMLARGVTSNITGSRADIIICDDVEVPRTSDTSEKRENLRARLNEINYVLVPGGTQLYVGTPHNYYSIYAEDPRIELDEDRIFLHGFERLPIPVMNEQGISAWPEKFTPFIIEQISAQTGPNKFASQMMLRAVNIVDARLDPSLLQVYPEDIEYAKELQSLFIGGRKMISASGWWDPAYGSERGDASVFAVIFLDDEANYYIHNMAYIKCTDPGGDAATGQCRQIAQIAKKMHLPSLTIEKNGIGAFLSGTLRNEMHRMNVPCSVIEFANKKPKDVRILEAFDAMLAARRIHVHKSVLKTPFMNEMQEWRPGRSHQRDDGLDAAAGAILQQPLRLKRLYSEGRHNWQRGAETYKANTDFKI